MKLPVLMLAPVMALGLLAADQAVLEADKKMKEGKYDEAISTLMAAEKAKPKSPEIKKALVDTHLAYADSFMSGQLPPRQKYPNALREYRKVLEYDKANAKAQKNINDIETIYKSMGRPIPQ